ncbi:TPA: hypothetical protein DD455_01300 [Candidatus Shapirobacteria bacterium]|nr:hypothetical protein [Candidatus Shapirobacteria bacterium]
MDCGYCPGVGVLPTPTPLPGGVTVSCNCSDYFSTALTVCDSTTFLCPGSNPAIYCYGLAGCNIPILGNVVIDNADSVAVTADASNRNHICEDTFVGASLPRRVIVEANVSDGDGYADISTVQLRWNGTIYNMSFVSGSINSATYRAVIDFSGAQNSGGTYAWEFNMVDADGNTSGWEDSIRSFKAWDCLVPVSGILYDGSAGQACNNTGFTTIIINATGFREMLYSNSLGVNDVAFVVSPPANYGSASLTWGQTYLPLINGGDVSNLNGDLTATGRFTRIIDEGVGTTSCPVNSQFNIGTYVSAYGLTPRAKVDMSFIRDQEAWFQVGGAGVKAKMDIDSGVPATMLPLSSRALSVSGINANNGLISYGGNFSNINGFNDSSAYGSPNNWYVNVNTNNLSNYSYQYFYNTFYVNGGIGVTGTSWNDHPSEGVYFVNGDMIVNSDFALASGKTLIVIVRGKISIGSNVNQVDGIFIADGNSSDSVGIEVGGTSDTQLLINGSLYSRKAIRLYRSFTDKIVNNTVPAVVIKYNPNLLFNMPGSLMRVLSGWREE